MLSYRTILESQLDGPSPTALASPGGIRDESIVEMVPKKPALNDLPSPPGMTVYNKLFIHHWPKNCTTVVELEDPLDQKTVYLDYVLLEDDAMKRAYFSGLQQLTSWLVFSPRNLIKCPSPLPSLSLSTSSSSSFLT